MKTNKEVTWILERTPEFTDPELLSKHVKKFAPIDNFNLLHANWPEVEGPCVVYGTFNCLTQMLKNPALCNYLFDDYSMLECSQYYRYVYPDLGRLAFILPINAIAHIDLERIFGPSFFVRPNSNKKTFEATIVKNIEVEAYLAKHPGHLYDLVVVSEVIQIDKEYRCFCRNGKTFCHSSYKESEYRAAPDHIIQFANSIAEKILSTTGMNMLTVDVAVCGSDLKLIEIGGVNSWGIYGVDIPQFIEEMEKEALERYQDIFL